MPEGMVKGPETVYLGTRYSKKRLLFDSKWDSQKDCEHVKYTKRGSAQHLPFASEQGRAWRTG